MMIIYGNPCIHICICVFIYLGLERAWNDVWKICSCLCNFLSLSLSLSLSNTLTLISLSYRVGLAFAHTLL